MATRIEINQARIEFLNYVEEGNFIYKFIDYTLLCQACPAFNKLTTNEAKYALNSVGYISLEKGQEDYQGNEILFALTTSLFKEDIAREYRYFKEKEMGEISYVKLNFGHINIRVFPHVDIVLKEFDEYEDQYYQLIFDRYVDKELPNRGFSEIEIAAIKRFINECTEISDVYEYCTLCNSKGENICQEQ